MKLSDQALATLMMALQKCLVEQTDIIPILKELDFELNESEALRVINPPSFKFDSQAIKNEHEKLQNQEDSSPFNNEKNSAVGSD